jgi:hypothetical protein
VGSQIAGSEVGFDFHDAASENFAPRAANNNFAQQRTGHDARIAVEESAREQARGSQFIFVVLRAFARPR